MDKLRAYEISQDILFEAFEASEKFDQFNSPHEGLAVILEEYEELKAEVFKKQANYDMNKMSKEAMHLGAMALRFIYDVVGDRNDKDN